MNELLDALLGNAITGRSVELDNGSVLHVPGRSGFAGSYQGREAILGLLDRLEDFSNDAQFIEPHRVVASNAHTIVVESTVRARRSGNELTTKAVQVVATRNERAREISLFFQDLDKVDELWIGRQSQSP